MGEKTILFHHSTRFALLFIVTRTCDAFFILYTSIKTIFDKGISLLTLLGSNLTQFNIRIVSVYFCFVF